jgi:glutathione peroxidase-family protein
MKNIINIFSAIILFTLFFLTIMTAADKLIVNHPVYVYTAKTIDGENIRLQQYEGKVLLIVNVASECGYTPQYAGLEELYKKYKDKGFEILGFPCNQFKGQEPKTNKEIKEFCTTKYGVTFPMFSKVEVNGDDALPLFQYLTGSNTDPIKWNFEKFLIDQRGIVVQRFRSKVEPKDIDAAIAKLFSPEIKK